MTFNTNHMKFSNVAQVNATIKYMRENKRGKLVQIPVKMKKAIIDLEVEYRDKVGRELREGKVNPEFVTNGKFSTNKFLKLCGVGNTYRCPKSKRFKTTGIDVNTYNRWKDHYDVMAAEVNLPDNCYSLSRQGASDNFQGGVSKGLGDLGRQSNALVRKVKEVALTNDAKEMGFKLVKMA